MEMADENTILLEGPKGVLAINIQDKLAMRLAMLYEGKCTELGPTKAAKKYGCTRQRFYQLFNAFIEGGSDALMPKKAGPKKNYVRTENVVNQIIRHRFLDPDAKVEVIAQKMQQTGIKISKRSVELTITEYGLQKKTIQVPSQRKTARD
jgi:transposase